MFIYENGFIDNAPLVKKLYNEDRIDPMFFGGYDEFINYLYGENEVFKTKGYITDTIEDLSSWSCFKDYFVEENDFF